MSTPSAYPTGTQYREAISATERCFADPALKGGTPVLDPLGLPKPISGNFASVFTIVSPDGKQWAVKCFTRRVPDQELRYKRISEALATVNKPWKVPFEYVHNGILCQGTWYPVLKMEWVEASNLIPYIEGHLWQPPDLAALAVQFTTMVDDLGRMGIAHGDLQHGNLLVTATGNLKLIDYDGMFVPGTEALGASENGHPHYQSHLRTMKDWGPYLDRFSAWVIYSSLVALVIEPTLWILLHGQGDEALLFHKEDFFAPNNSQALGALSQSPDERLRVLARALSPVLVSPLATIPTLDPARAPVPSIDRPFFEPVPAAVPGSWPSGQDSSRAISDWLSAIAGNAVQAGGAADASWVLQHGPPDVLASFEPATLTSKLALAACTGTVILALLLGVLSVLAPTVVFSVVGAVLLSGFATSGFLFRRTPQWCENKGRKIEYRRARSTTDAARAKERKAQEYRSAIDRREKEAVAALSTRSKQALSSEQRELQGMATWLAARISEIENQLRSLQGAEANELGQALRTLQEQHIRGHLSSARIAQAGIPNIGPGITENLRFWGIVSAADFTGVSYVGSSATNGTVLIHRRDGSRVQVPGVGEARAMALESWRRWQEQNVRATQPSSLPPAQAGAISATYAFKRQAFAQETEQVRREARQKDEQARQKRLHADSLIMTELARSRQSFVAERAEADARLEAARRDAAAASWRQASLERDLQAHRRITYRGYCRRVLRRARRG